MNVIRRERELKAMVAAVAHEIRNPLGGIALFAGLLSDEIGPDDPARKHLERIQAEVRYLNDIVHRFLEYAKPDTPQPESFMLSDVLEETYDILRQRLESSRIRLIMTGDDPKRQLCSDPGHLRRILINLLENSVNAVQTGGSITVGITADNGLLRIQIADSGPGITPEHQDRIFEPFFTTREKGSGLGLAIVKRLTEALGGRIGLVQSGPEGTVFEFVLPENLKMNKNRDSG
ncbi:HAMP domain-containing histidine kinase, partial [bacterium]|nr:HAMP domain-containing histidine kinase [bacterium]